MGASLYTYFALTYLLSWSIWIPLALTGLSNQWFFWLAGFAPTISALGLTAFQGGRSGLRRLLRLRWRTKLIWYAISLLGTPFVILIALGLHVVLGGGGPQYVDSNHLVTSLEQWPLAVIVFLYIFIFAALGEEIGWRAYALPHLQARFSPFGSGLILGLVWAFWHLPLFWMTGNFHQQLPVSWFVLQILGSTFLYTWFYNRTDGNLLIAMLFHTTSNAAVGLLPILPLDNDGSLRPLWLVVGLLWLVVCLVLWFERRLFFQNSARSSNGLQGIKQIVGSMFFVLVLVVAGGCRQQPFENRDSLEVFTTHLDRRIPLLMDRYNIPGVSMSLIRGGELVWSNAYGYADLEHKRRMTVDAVCRAESISKSVTAWGVMKLVEQGRIDLDAPVQNYLTGWNLPGSKYDEQAVTVRMLLSGSAGLPLGTISREIEYAPRSEMPSLQDYLAQEAYLIQEPGAGYAYSNVGFNLLELLIEDVTGRDFAEYMADEVLHPLGMQSSSFDWEESFENFIPNGYELDSTPVPPYVYPVRASGGLFASVEDIARFVSSGMTGAYYTDHGVLTEDSLRQLYTPQVEVSGIYSLVSEHYGFGHFIETLPDEQVAVWHGGQGHGWMTHFHSVPESGDGIVILTNSQRSWPLIADVLSEWARWNGSGPVMFSRITYATTASWVLIGLVILLTLALVYRLVRDLRSGNRRFAPFSPKSQKGRWLQTALGLGMIALLAWRVFQPYLFETSIFPASAGWAGVSFLGLSVVLILLALFPHME